MLRRLSLAALILAPVLAFSALQAPQPDAVTPDGGRYYGPLVKGVRQGQGRIEWDSGMKYAGGFQDGLYAGKGTLTGNGSRYTGEFRAGLPHGNGEQVWDDGRTYRGGFAQGRFEGQGRYQDAAGDVYEGIFARGEPAGTMHVQRTDGSRYEGPLRNWRPHGKGRYTAADGAVYEGQFVDGELDGKGRMIGRDGSTYEGGFKDWLYEGEGRFRFRNGDEYRGSFARNLFNGRGTYTYADGRPPQTGVWRDGELGEASGETRTRRNVEQALYLQRPLLDKALQALQPRDPGKINLYLLAVAGDGSQEVFRREVEFVRQRFDREFGTAGRSLALVNSRTTVATLPMATHTSLREALRGIAAKMDTEHDILFLFLTSHGSREHALALNQNGMDLPDLPARDLAALLKESGIRWKAVVVSACYSGGFIDPLKDERTMVLTAARRDRTSFGCADDNDFTFFGRAFFKEALGADGDFPRAFEQAKVLIDKWEKEEIAASKDKDEPAAHSEPQIWLPAPMRTHLAQWRAQRKPR